MKSPIKILIVTHYFDLHQGGIEAVAGNIARGLAKRGFQVSWAAAHPQSSDHSSFQPVPLKTWNLIERVTGVPVPIPSPSAIRTLSAAVDAADVVMLHDCLYLGNIVAYRAALKKAKPVVIVQHVGLVPYRNRLLRALMNAGNRFIARPMLSRADQVVFISQLTRRSFEGVTFKRAPLDIYNGVDTELFRPLRSDEDRAALRKLHGLPVATPVALFVGRFVEKKGLPILEALLRRAPEITCAFAGSGPIDPRAWNLPNALVFSGLSREHLAELYRLCDVLVLPSKGEGFPLVIQEALASGLRVICGADTAEADPAIAAHVRGVPLDESDSASASSLLPVLRGELAKSPTSDSAAVALAQSRYSWDSVIDQYAELLQTILPS